MKNSKINYFFIYFSLLASLNVLASYPGGIAIPLKPLSAQELLIYTRHQLTQSGKPKTSGQHPKMYGGSYSNHERYLISYFGIHPDSFILLQPFNTFCVWGHDSSSIKTRPVFLHIFDDERTPEPMVYWPEKLYLTHFHIASSSEEVESRPCLIGFRFNPYIAKSPCIQVYIHPLSSTQHRNFTLEAESRSFPEVETIGYFAELYVLINDYGTIILTPDSTAHPSYCHILTLFNESNATVTFKPETVYIFQAITRLCRYWEHIYKRSALSKAAYSEADADTACLKLQHTAHDIACWSSTFARIPEVWCDVEEACLAIFKTCKSFVPELEGKSEQHTRVHFALFHPDEYDCTVPPKAIVKTGSSSTRERDEYVIMQPSSSPPNVNTSSKVATCPKYESTGNSPLQLPSGMQSCTTLAMVISDARATISDYRQVAGRTDPDIDQLLADFDSKLSGQNGVAGIPYCADSHYKTTRRNYQEFCTHSWTHFSKSAKRKHLSRPQLPEYRGEQTLSRPEELLTKGMSPPINIPSPNKSSSTPLPDSGYSGNNFVPSPSTSSSKRPSPEDQVSCSSGSPFSCRTLSCSSTLPESVTITRGEISACQMGFHVSSSDEIFTTTDGLTEPGALPQIDIYQLYSDVESLTSQCQTLVSDSSRHQGNKKQLYDQLVALKGKIRCLKQDLDWGNKQKPELQAIACSYVCDVHKWTGQWNSNTRRQDRKLTFNAQGMF